MKIDVYTVPSEVLDGGLRGENVVVIDVLRASSSLLNAFQNSCREVFPVESIERALSLHSALFTSDVLLCGERDGVKIAGFHLGNSPFEYTKEAVDNKSLIFTSTNGSNALIKAKNSNSVYLCGFPNIDIVARQVAKTTESLKILCAGENNHFALEDVVCAGMLIDKIGKTVKEKPELTDAANMAFYLYQKYADDLNGMIRNSDHGNELIHLGMQDDLEFCIRINSIPLLLRYIDGKLQKEE